MLSAEAGEIEPAIALWQEAESLYALAGVQAGVQECDAHVKRLAGK